IINAWHAYENSLERKPCSARTLQGYKMYFSIFESWINNNYSELVYMRDVISDIATEYATNIIQAGKSGNTFNKHIGFLKRIFREFATEIRADKNPFENIQRREQNTQSRRELTLQELITVIDDATGELALLLLIGGVTGLRLGDCATLQWSEVDLIRGLVRRIPNKTARRKQKPVVVGIPQMLLNALNKLEDKTGYVMPGMAERYTRDKNHGNIEKEIQRHFEACGIQCHKEGTGAGTEKRAIVEVGFHSLRHTYVSLHAERGTSVTVIQGNVGHGSPAMTAHYTHISEDKAVEVAKVLDCITTEAQEVPLEPQRERLKQLADTLSLEKIERIINTLQEY
ncbi:MAG: tyrosine-type recombinase/integrase, partial [Victivallaceae bacterium]|nr:tyrosine-type recombinase/integrase [Victivallaceae bacterium]